MENDPCWSLKIMQIRHFLAPFFVCFVQALNPHPTLNTVFSPEVALSVHLSTFVLEGLQIPGSATAGQFNKSHYNLEQLYQLKLHPLMPRKSSCDCAHSQQFDSAGDRPFTMSNEHYVKWSHRLLFVQSAEFIRNEMDKHSNCSDEI